MKKKLILVLLAGTLLFGAFVRDGSKTVTTAGTAERLVSASTPAVWVTVQCAVDNAGNCFVGGPTIADGRGVELVPGQGQHFQALANRNSYDLYEIWVDVEQNGEGVTFTYAERGP